MSTWKDLLEISNDIVWQLNTSHKFDYIGDSILDALGYEVEELIGKKFFDIIAVSL